MQQSSDARERLESLISSHSADLPGHALKEYLLGTGDAVLVEASSRDRIWGVGLGPSNRDARRPERWRGRNLLGFALMEVRARLMARA